MKVLFKNLLLSLTPPDETPPSETECLLLEIEQARKKIDYAWNRLNNAEAAYVESAVLELFLVEAQYGVLNKRYRMMLGLNDENRSPLMPYRASLRPSDKPSETSSQSLPQ